MSKWILTDDQERVLASNPNDMAGNTGWHSTTSALPEELHNEDGVPLYKRNGSRIVARSAEEIAADTPAPVMPAVPEAQRLDEVETALVELAGLIAGGE